MQAVNPSTPRRSPRKAEVIKSETEDHLVLANGVKAEEESEDSEESDSDNENVLEIQMKAFMRNVKKLQENFKETRKKNQKLQRQLDAYKDGLHTTPRRRAAGNIEDKLKIQELEECIEELERKNSALKKKVRKLLQAQLKAEADELNDDGAIDGVWDPDGFNNMRKLLRRFSDMMSITTLGEEDCVICYERLKSAKTYGMPCDHLVCAECLPKISRGADETVKCPLCRQHHPREDLELLRYTETERWDELLVIAKASSVIDYGAGTTTSEEEEEEFIDDEESRMEASNRDEAVVQEEEEEPDGGSDPGSGEEGRVKKEEPVSPRLTPERPGTHSYAASPISEKRKRMQDLAQLRSEKRRRVL